MPELLPELLWEDGLLLRPHHLQALQQHCVQVAASAAGTRPYAYGVRHLEIRENSVRNWVLELGALAVGLPDGTPLVLGENAIAHPVEFRHLGNEAATLDVWLAVPFLCDSAPNVLFADRTPHDGNGHYRFLASTRTCKDENTGANPRELETKLFNVRVVVGHRPAQGFQTLKIAELRKILVQGEEVGRYELSDRFVPACLNVEASPLLHGILKDLLDRLEEKNAELLAQIGKRRDLLTGESTDSPGTLIKLQAINGVLPVLRQLVGHSSMHPFEVYLQLTRLVGDLAVFSDDWTPPKLVLYDHEDPLKAFADLREKWMTLLDAAVATTIGRQSFSSSAELPHAQEVRLPDSFLAVGVELFVGVESAREPDEVAALFSEGRTKLAAPSDHAAIRHARINGIRCALDRRLQQVVRDRERLVFLRIEQEGELWATARRDRALVLWGEALEDADTKFLLYATNLPADGEGTR